jgi:hypothetical protein
MTPRPTCPYIEVQRSAHRPMTARGLGPIEVHEVWYCRHPFHGLPVPLGDVASAAARRCGLCPLPRDQQERAEGAHAAQASSDAATGEE